MQASHQLLRGDDAVSAALFGGRSFVPDVGEWVQIFFVNLGLLNRLFSGGRIPPLGHYRAICAVAAVPQRLE